MKNNKLKLASAVLATALLAGCSSTQTDDSASAQSAAAEQAAAERMAAERMAAERMAAERAAAEAAAALETVFYFDFDRATLRPEVRQALDAQIARLKTSSAAIRLEGHADERGTREYNMALGERRANAVANYMAVNGIKRSRIETVSYGEERPLVTASNEAAWGQNRRVELK